MADSATLRKIREKYSTDQASSRRAFDRTARSSSRMSDVPALAKEYDLEEHARTMTRLTGNMVDLANEYDKLNANFQNTSLLGADKFYEGFEGLKHYWLRTTGQSKKARQIQIDAVGRKARRLVYIVDKIAEIFDDNYHSAMDGRQQMQEILVNNLAHRKDLETKIIGSLRDSYASNPERATLEAELKKMESEISELDRVLAQYERQVEDAKAKDNPKRVEELTAEMLEVLDIKYGILEGRTAAQNADRELRMKILDSAEGVQSARNALQMANANAEQLVGVIDVLWKTEIKYKHAREDVIPLFKDQARIATESEASRQLIETYKATAAISSELVMANAQLVGAMVKATMELLTMTFYDPSVSEKARAQFNQTVKEARALEDRWASEVLVAVQKSPGYAVQR